MRPPMGKCAGSWFRGVISLLECSLSLQRSGVPQRVAHVHVEVWAGCGDVLHSGSCSCEESLFGYSPVERGGDIHQCSVGLSFESGDGECPVDDHVLPHSYW